MIAEMLEDRPTPVQKQQPPHGSKDREGHFGHNGGLSEFGNLDDTVPHHPESKRGGDPWKEGGREGGSSG